VELALLNSTGLHLEYDDQTTFGSMISGQLEARLKRGFQPLIELLQRDSRRAIQQGPALLDALGLTGSGGFLSAPGVLRDDLVCPAPGNTRPATLRIDRPGSRPAKIALSESIVIELAAWLGEWQRGAAMPTSRPARDLWTALSELGCLERPQPRTALRGVATFVGHATVLLTGPRTRLLIDPFLLPDEASFPPGYRPLTYDQLAPDAILVTHSHPDHFHVDSLMRLGRDTPVYVPDVSRESALAVDMSYRLHELGFTDVQPLRWRQETTVGDFRVTTLPFYGEQPTTDAVLNPDVRNLGNNYLIEGAGRRYAFVADAGCDRLGDVRQLATEMFERSGPVDLLFGGYRSWSLYPLQYVLTSVPQFLLFTPPSLWTTRQRIMNDQHALLDTAERWHARHVVPYANGGAPWYWQLGLGPRQDRHGHDQDDYFDPPPETVVRAAAARSGDGSHSFPSPVATHVVRPGESLDFDAAGDLVVLPNDGHVWPYADIDAAGSAPGSTAEPMGLTRKRVLLRILAMEEMRRRGLRVTMEQVADMSDDLRNQNGLLDQDQMFAWLEHARLSMAEYCEVVAEWQGVIQLETIMADEIEKHVEGQRAFASMRDARR
jgi:L-ascorbate metabolism protein UlaG (beta-lactamase superfamily)